MSDPTAIGAPVWQGRRTGPRRRDIDWSDPFSRLALCHFGEVSGEALLAISLAGSLFFSVNPSNGREKVLLGLLLTMTPFALVGPLIGPFIDKVPGGHRAVIILTLALRSVIAVLMAIAAASGSIALFPEAFLMLVLGKTYQIAKAALVPSTVDGDAALVEANSHLQVLSGLSSIVAGIPGAALAWIGPSVSLAFTAVVFAATTVTAFGLIGDPASRSRRHDEGSSDVDRAERRRRATAELRSGAVMTASTAMAILRGMVGLVSFALAFELRGETGHGAPPKWYFGAVIAVSVLGGLVGASVAPRLRRIFAEERILLGSTLLAAVVGVGALLVEGLGRDVLLAAGVTIASTTAKQAFDALVQRDAPDADRGRLFAMFESRFQVVWVVGAVVPAAIHLPVSLASAMVLVAGIVATVLFASGMKRVTSVAADPAEHEPAPPAATASPPAPPRPPPPPVPPTRPPTARA